MHTICCIKALKFVENVKECKELDDLCLNADIELIFWVLIV